MPPPRSTRRRSRGGSPVAAQVLAQLTAARDQLDAAAADRRRREDELLREWATAAGDAADTVARRDAALADLERQRQAVLDAAAAETATAQTRQAAALAELTRFRTAEEIGALVGMNEKRVRQIVRAHREACAETAKPAQPSAAGAPDAAARLVSRPAARPTALGRSSSAPTGADSG
jgi:hypothetical protein